jgi:hypothetical protein
MRKNAQTLAVILDTLADVGAQHALFGGVVAGYYGNGRPTADVDVLVSRCFIKHISARIEQRGYLVREFQHLLKMYVPGELKSAGDIVVQETNSVLSAAFLATAPGLIFGLPVKIVKRGVFVALKFQAATTLRRRLRDRIRDVQDIRQVLEKEFGPQDQQLASDIAAKMYPGAEKQLEGLITDLRYGRWPQAARRAAIHSRLLVRRGISTPGGTGLPMGIR